MTAQLAPQPIFKAFDNNGAPLANGQVFSYIAGTTTKQATYTDYTQGTPNTNPIRLNARGEAAIWLDPTLSYKLVLSPSTDTDPPTAAIWTSDQINGVLNPSSSLIPSVDNVYNLGSTSKRWANGYFYQNIFFGSANNALVSSSGNAAYFARTAAESAASVTPVDYSYAPGVVNRYQVNTTPGTTDMAAGFAAAALVFAQGQDITILEQQYLIGSQVTFTPPNYRQALISGYGCELFTSGAISAIKIIAGSSPPHGVTVRGITVNQRNNTTSIAAFEGVGATQVHWLDLVVEANNCPAGYGGVFLHNTTPSDNNTGCFWNIIENVAVRKRSGGDAGTIPAGVILQGSANATRIINCDFQSAVVGVQFQVEAGQTFLSNGVLIHGCSFEGFTTGIAFTQSTAAGGGLRVIGCRAESGTTFFSQTGSVVAPAVPNLLAFNYLISSVTTYINNPSAQTINTFDWSVTPDLVVGPSLTGDEGLTIIPLGSGKHAFSAWSSGTAGTGYALYDNAGALRARWGFGGSPSGARLTGTVAIAQSDTLGNNLAGTATFSAATTKVVAFANNEPDANYRVQVTFTADPGGRWWVSGKGTTGFTVNSSTSNSASFDWVIIRD